MTKRKKTLMRIFLLPLLFIVLMQGIIPFLTLVFSGVKDNLEQNNIQMADHVVENRQVVLENDMVEKWRSIYKESDALGNALEQILQERNIDMQQFMSSGTVQQAYLQRVFPDMVDNLQYNTASGVFLILANDSSVKEEAKYHGFFLRDSDPQNRTMSNADLLLERGSKELSQNLSIPLDNSWATDFDFLGQGNREADDFFYKPYIAAGQHTNTAMVNLGYWSLPFILEDHYMDNHQMITYSVPLLYENTIYGILGVEIGISYLSSYFDVKDLDSDLNAGYALLIQTGEEEYQGIAGKGALYDTVIRNSNRNTMTLAKQDEEALYQVQDARIGNQNIYAVMKPITLYGNYVPYENTQWVLCGLVTEDSIYKLGNSLYTQMLTILLCSTILAIGTGYILVRYVTRPVYRLMESVRGGINGLHNFERSDILEIDELHDVVENLADSQKRTQEQLVEEKERYQIAVESSQDVFFTYRKKEGFLEIVNDGKLDGIWKCDTVSREGFHLEDVHPEDRERLLDYVQTAGAELDIDFRLRYKENEDYIWVNLSGTARQDEDGDYSRFVGCIQNIHQRKLLEEERRNKQLYDPVTAFYRLAYGLEAVRKETDRETRGIFALINVERFSYINEQYGLMFGDILLEQLAVLLVKRCQELELIKSIFIRAGDAQLLVWIPQADTQRVKEMLEMVRRQFIEVTNEKYLALNIKSGITVWQGEFEKQRVIRETKTALLVAKWTHVHETVYQELSETEKETLCDMNFSEVTSLGRLKQMSLSSIALNLFDRNGEVPVILDVLALKLREQYGISNLIITQFNREYMVNSLSYRWKGTEENQQWDGIVHCTGSQYQQYIETKNMQEIQQITGSLLEDPTIGVFAQNSGGLVFHMTDNGVYSGTIFFLGIDRELLEQELERKHFNEICSVIQNKINLQRHDLSAQAKSDFLARMSHEIRTPMNGIIGMTEIALREEQSEQKRVECLKKIENASNYLLGLLNDILDMSKIESGKMRLVMERCNLAKLLESLEPLLEPKMKEKQIHFTQNITLQHDWFLCDELRINQVLMNLLSNAIKYSRDNGNVKLTVTEGKTEGEVSEIYFEVQDDGIGIAKEKQQLIFQSFEQADQSQNARKQGTGLGLAISSRLVHMMDADIGLESEPDKGSTFYFTLQLHWVTGEQTVTSAPVTRKDFTGKRVLIVEDNELNMEIARNILEECKITVEEAHNGKEAVERMEKVAPGYYDLILMDIMMPVMDGLEATRAIRKIEREDCKTVPIVAMSANAFDEDVKQSLASGMNGHISKPISISRMEKMLAEVL